jgi:hypothetical protein
MVKISALQKRAAFLGRALFASLPPSVRLAYVFSILAGTDVRSLGRTLGVVFIEKEVHGLPDISSGKYAGPALDFPVKQLRAEGKDPSRFLPPNYLEGFAESLQELLHRKYHNDDAVDRAISAWLFTFILDNKWEQMRSGISLTEARSFVLRSLENATINQLRGDKRQHRDISIDRTDEEGTPLFTPDDPKALRHMLEGRGHIWNDPHIKRELETGAHPDAPLWLDLLMQGYTSNEILGDPRKDLPSMLPHYKAVPQLWGYRILPKILRVFQRHAPEYLGDPEKMSPRLRGEKGVLKKGPEWYKKNGPV